MESRYYETIQETGHLQARFEPVISPARVFPAHWHEYVEILYIREGSLSAIVQASEYDLSAGDLMIINSGDLHMTRTGGSHYLILQISARQLRAYLPDFDRLRITRVMEWIRAHYQENLTLDAAASLLAVSREYFCRLFKKYTGQTFLEYLNDVRTMHLSKDLLTCDDTITSLMEKHGLTNYKVFLRTFRKLYGTSPQKFRQAAIGDGV